MSGEDDRLAQEDELLVLDSIYANDNDMFSYEPDNQGTFTYKGTLTVKCDLNTSVRLTCKAGSLCTDIDALPSIMLQFWLPVDYPSHSAPKFELRATWCTESLKSLIASKLKASHSDNFGCPILHVWTDDVRDCVLDNLPPEIDMDQWHTQLSSSVQAAYSPSQIYHMLVDFNNDYNDRKFAQNEYDCAVCTERYVGSRCVRFSPCAHVFCLQCTQMYFETLIKDGAVYKLSCLMPNCTSLSTQTQVRRVLNDMPNGAELYERYESQLFSATLDMMSDIVRCPRPTCEQPVLLDADQDPSSRRMATCSVCSYTFCTYCRKGYHGLAACSFTKADKTRLVSEYQSAAADMRAVMELRFGKATLQRLVDEHQASEWIIENSKPCPSCKVNIERSHGCNKMVCSRCGTPFCWLCMTLLNANNPYAHFNSQAVNSSCYNRLFEGVDIDVEDEWI